MLLLTALDGEPIPEATFVLGFLSHHFATEGREIGLEQSAFRRLCVAMGPLQCSDLRGTFSLLIAGPLGSTATWEQFMKVRVPRPHSIL